MIDEMIRTRLRARPVGEDGRLAYGGYMVLQYDPAEPYEVRLAGLGPYAAEVVFARELLEAALAGEPAGEGHVRAQLKLLPGARHALLLLSIGSPDDRQEIALTDAKVAAFLRDTTHLVPRGEEWRRLDLDAGIDALLREAA
jgi:Streptomyces sporulation and cell division protein, SsgA